MAMLAVLAFNSGYAGCLWPQYMLAGCNGILYVMANLAGYDCWICWLD
jgi:hypothetical protein